jgi:outer membrane protein assembly factor BamB
LEIADGLSDPMGHNWQTQTLPRTASRCSLLFILVSLNAVAGDWPQYRGPNHDATSSERINTDWTGSITNPVWRVQLTNGLTSLTVSGGRVFTQVKRNVGGQNKDVCLALSASTGAELWATPVENTSYPNGGVGFDDGPRSTPVVNADSVYVFTAYQKLYRLNAANGAILWSTNLVAGFGGTVIQWQSAASPVIENGMIFLNAAGSSGTLMAFDAANGTLVWRSQNEGMTHSTPVLATMNGMRQLIFATQSGLVSLNPSNGTLLWKAPYPFTYSISIGASPAVYQNIVFLSAHYNMGAVAVQIVQNGATQAAVQLWAKSDFMNHWATPVCYQGALFGPFVPDDHTAEFRCIDLLSGEQRWSVPNFGRGGTLLVGTNLLIITERGDLVLAEANPNQYVELQRFTAIPGFDGFRNKCWNALALSDGQIYVRSTAYAARFDLSVPGAKPALKLDPPTISAGAINLTIRTATGTLLDSNRLTGMEVLASTNAALSPNLWTKITNDLVLENGVVNVTNVNASPQQGFFIVNEPE